MTPDPFSNVSVPKKNACVGGTSVHIINTFLKGETILVGRYCTEKQLYEHKYCSNVMELRTEQLNVE